MAPLETKVEGKVVFELAFTRHRGQPIEDLVVRFEGGKAISVEAKVIFQAFTDVLANSHGDKEWIGELGIGLNDQVREAIGYVLTDEKIMGTVHIAIGENRVLGWVNDSDLHWDLLVMEPRGEVDDRLITEGGTFLAYKPLSSRRRSYDTADFASLADRRLGHLRRQQGGAGDVCAR